MGTNWAHVDRAEICDLFESLGPDAPTLCGDWRTHELAAHLALREARPDAALGIGVPALSGLTDRAQATYVKRPYDELVTRVRTGPPTFSPFNVPGADRTLNTAEYFVHVEDVLRAQTQWQPRQLPLEYRNELWSILKKRGRLLLSKARVGIECVRTDVQPMPRATITRNEPKVLVSGASPELVMFAFGRKEHAEVEFVGAEDAVELLMNADLSV